MLVGKRPEMRSIRSRATGLILVSTLIGACAHEPAPSGRPEGDVIGRETVTYQGEVPCADCPGLRLTVTLFPDHTYRMRGTYVGAASGRDDHRYELGRWARAQDHGANRLRLQSSATTTRQFLIQGARILRMLDRQGREIPSTLNYDLGRLPGVDPVAGPMRLRGLYAYMADAATFSECLTGKRYPVAMEEDHLALERAYLAARRAAGELLTATLDGRFVERAAEPGAALREHIAVERFDRLWPGETCAPQALGTASLLETYWRPVEIEGEPVALQAGTREPHFVLSREGSRMRGYTGCNSLAGGFEQDAEGFRFKSMVATLMACLPAANDLHARFVAALTATASIRLAGDTLELRDREGKVRMRLEARYLR